MWDKTNCLLWFCSIFSFYFADNYLYSVYFMLAIVLYLCQLPFDTFKLIDNPYKIKRNLTLRQMETFLTVLHTLIYQIPHI